MSTTTKGLSEYRILDSMLHVHNCFKLYSHNIIYYLPFVILLCDSLDKNSAIFILPLCVPD